MYEKNRTSFEEIRELRIANVSAYLDSQNYLTKAMLGAKSQMDALHFRVEDSYWNQYGYRKSQFGSHLFVGITSLGMTIALFN